MAGAPISVSTLLSVCDVVVETLLIYNLMEKHVVSSILFIKYRMSIILRNPYFSFLEYIV